jgi:hypothetical protein
LRLGFRQGHGQKTGLLFHWHVRPRACVIKPSTWVSFKIRSWIVVSGIGNEA